MGRTVRGFLRGGLFKTGKEKRTAMRILHLIGGGDVGGAKTHVISLVSRLKDYCEVKLVSFREGPFAEDCRAAGIDTIVDESRSIGAAYRKLLKVVDEFRPDVLHCHGARANMMGVLVKRKRRIPTVTTIHSDYRLDYMGNLRKHLTFGMINRFCLRRMDYYTCVADRTARMMIARGFSPSRVFPIYNGIDFVKREKSIDRAAYLARFGAAYCEGDVLCGIAARLTAVKDLPTLIKACALAVSRGAPLKLVIAGDGEDRASLEALARELGVADRVIFAGWITDIHEFFRAMDINVLCSLSETFPYVVLEGIDEGCATVTSDVGGMPELIDSGVNGYIFAPRDVETLSGQLYTLSQDAQLRRTFAARLWDKASAHFSLDHMARTQFEIYNKVQRRYAMRGKRAGVLICGAYGKGNAGDDAILRAIVNELRAIDPDMPVCVMSRRPTDTALDYRVDSIFTFDILKMHERMRNAAVYINGGGSLIQDITSNRSLYFYLYTLAAAARRGARVMMYGCGIGPVISDRNRRRAARVLNRCVDTITLREDDSRAELGLMGVTRPHIAMAADPALTLSPAPDEVIDAAFASAGIPPHGNYICLCVRNWPGFESAVPVIAKAASYAREAHGLELVILPIEMPKDAAAGDAVARALAFAPHVFRQRFDTETTIGIISRMKCVLSMRLHALVFAAREGVPNAGIVYDKKVKGFMRYMHADLYIDLDNIDAETLCVFIDEMMETSRAALLENAARLCELEHENVAEAMRLIGE